MVSIARRDLFASLSRLLALTRIRPVASFLLGKYDWLALPEAISHAQPIAAPTRA